jgi:hypothetical protein
MKLMQPKTLLLEKNVMAVSCLLRKLVVPDPEPRLLGNTLAHPRVFSQYPELT